MDDDLFKGEDEVDEEEDGGARLLLPWLPPT